MRILSLAALLLAGAAQAATEPLSLRDAVAEALAKNPEAAASRARSAAARAGLAEARSMWLPRVDVTESATRSDDPVFVFASLLEQGRFGPQHFDPAFLNDPDPLRSYRLGLNVRFMLFDQFRRLDANAAAKNGVAQAESGSEEVRQQLRGAVIARYFGVALAEAKRDVAAEAVRAAESQAKAIRDKFEQGLVVESDLLATEVQLASFRQQEIEAEGDAAIARAALATMLQRPADAEIAVDARLPEVRAADEPLLQAAIDAGLAARGEVRAARASSRNAELALRTARGSFLPRLDAFANWSATGSTIGGRNPDHTVALLASFDVFDGGKIARAAAARAGVDAATAAESATHDRIVMEIVTAYHRARAARQRVDVASKALAQAEAATRIVRDRYEHGLTTITEQLRAETALVGARLALIAARYDALVGRAELLRATGGFHDVESF